MRGIRALLSEFCTVRILEGLKKLSTLWDSKDLHTQEQLSQDQLPRDQLLQYQQQSVRIWEYCNNGASIGTMSSGHICEVACK